MKSGQVQQFPVLLSFLKAGTFAFGGPLASVSYMEHELCEHRRWMTHEEFVPIYATVKLLPGATATQMTIALVQYLTGSRLLGVLAALLFILPAFLMILCLGFIRAWIPPSAQSVLHGLQIGALACILLSVFKLGKSFWTGVWSTVPYWIPAFVLTLISPRLEPVVILATGFFMIARVRKPHSLRQWVVWSSVAGALFFAAALALWASRGGSAAGALNVQNGSAVAAVVAPSLFELFWSTLSAGALIFGTGVAILPLLEVQFTQAHAWVSHSDFMTAMTFGQLTPGPVLVTATALGFLTRGVWGAVAATVGAFLTSFLQGVWVYPVLRARLAALPEVTVFYRGASLAVVGALAAMTGILVHKSLGSPVDFILLFSLLSLSAVLGSRMPSWGLIVLGGLAGGLGAL